MTDQPSPSHPATRRRVLFVAEAVTLAHVARLIVLARELARHPTRYQITLACAPRYQMLFGELPFAVRSIHSIPSERFLYSLARGSPTYDFQTLRGYVEEDLSVIREEAPDVVVGDFRLSLSVSARLTGIPYMAISNAYWSPYARQRFPLPDLPVTERVGLPRAQAVFRLVRPFIFAYHTQPLNRVRRLYGLPSLGFDLTRVYTDADFILYADIPELLPTYNLPTNHHYLGAIPWSPAVPLPAWWEQLPSERPVIYVTLGSSGRSDLLEVVLRGLASVPATVVAATAGHVHVTDVPGNAFVADYLPGEAAAARADLVICNGGSPTSQQALVAGKPVLGIASNMDHYLNMEAICRAGAGELVRGATAREDTIQSAVGLLLAETRYAAAASRLATAFAAYHAPTRFRTLLEDSLASRLHEKVAS